MRRVMLYAGVISGVFMLPAPGFAQTIRGKDLKWFNSVALSDRTLSGNGIMVADNDNNGGDIGFDIPAKYAGKKVKVTFEVKSAGMVRLGVDDFMTGLLERTEWQKMPKQDTISLECTLPNDVKNLKAVVRQDVGVTVFVAFGKIEEK
jgi:hypothetical protein